MGGGPRRPGGGWDLDLARAFHCLERGGWREPMILGQVSSNTSGKRGLLGVLVGTLPLHSPHLQPCHMLSGSELCSSSGRCPWTFRSP